MLKNEFIKLFRTKTVYIALVIGMLSAICGLISYYDTAYWSYEVGRQEEISAYNAWLDCLSIGSSVYRLLMPLIIVPFLDSYYIEKKSGYQNFLLVRTRRIRYFFSKWFVGLCSAIGIVFITLSVTFAICVILFPLNQPLEYMTHLHKNFGLQFFLCHPLGCIILMICSNMFCAAVFYTLGYSCSNLITNRYLLMLVPFCIYIFLLLVSQIFGLACCSPLIFIAYYEVMGLNPVMMIIVGVVYLLIATIALLYCLVSDKKL